MLGCAHCRIAQPTKSISSGRPAGAMGATKQKYGNLDDFLYDPDLLKIIDFSGSSSVFSPSISALEPGEPWLLVRPLNRLDYDKGFLRLLSQLTDVGTTSKNDFERNFAAMKASGGYYVTVIEDTRKSEIIGSASLITELKFIHGCGLRGRLEDVVVNNTYRGKQLGKLYLAKRFAGRNTREHDCRIVMTVTLLAKALGCYKMTLDCKDKLIPFYVSLGYKLEPGNSNSMTIRYDTPPNTAVS